MSGAVLIMNRQEIVCDYIQTHYVEEGRLRHDVISNKVQINDGMSRADALNDEMMNAKWRDVTTSDFGATPPSVSQMPVPQVSASPSGSIPRTITPAAVSITDGMILHNYRSAF